MLSSINFINNSITREYIMTNFNQREYYAVILAALLHDVGKEK